jgi:hypothetical protein
VVASAAGALVGSAAGAWVAAGAQAVRTNVASTIRLSKLYRALGFLVISFSYWVQMVERKMDRGVAFFLAASSFLEWFSSWQLSR